MYLSRALLNPISRAVRADIADIEGLHRTIMRAFPDDAGPHPRKAHGVLFRVDEAVQRGRFVLLVQSATRPDFTRLPKDYFLDIQEDLGFTEPSPIENPAIREVGSERARIGAGDFFRFRLRANPTRRIDTKSGDDGKRRNGRRVELRDEASRIGWLRRKAEEGGFALCGAEDGAGAGGVSAVEERKLTGRKSGASDERQHLTLAPVLFEGRLRVTDASRFREALAAGIGPAKAYGFGLLSIAPAQG
ncbi:type I-E CRISPR-associated protein Cas6/Cse3/CasE [Sorangium sp. So ce1504]|uniref:type I-E CRISPR-associated protein Cas6/Cse3/CasE n=1 Tax=Sorangium sp. So ce1504 TaxID=3133337 RepID=UPI003F607074